MTRILENLQITEKQLQIPQLMYQLQEVFWVGIGSFQKRDKIQTITNRCEGKKKKKTRNYRYINTKLWEKIHFFILRNFNFFMQKRILHENINYLKMKISVNRKHWKCNLKYMVLQASPNKSWTNIIPVLLALF